MNRIKAVNEIVRVLEAEFPLVDIFPEHELNKKTKPCLVVTAASEEAHESIKCASELSIELMTEVNDEDGGGIDFDTLAAYTITDDFRDEITLGGIVTAHRVEEESSEIEREERSTKQTLTLKVWVYGE